jgi:ribosomal-protein-alanine N-acetyltransferase
MPATTLRPLREEDIPALCREAHSTRIFEHVRDHFPYPYREEDARDFIRLQAQIDPPQAFAIAQDDVLIGVISYQPQHDVYRFSAEVGYWLGESHWGRGIVTEALKAMVRHLFATTDLQRLYATVFAFNTASMRALEKAGFHNEGVSVQHVFKNARFWDEHRYYLLREQHQR